MNLVSLPRAMAVAVTCAVALLTGCSGDGGTSDGGSELPMGWIEREDEPTGVVFAMPPPVSEPEEREREGRATPVVSRTYTANTGALLFSVQFLSTPSEPTALEDEVRVDRVPYFLIDEMELAEQVQVDVLSNQVVMDAEVPTYDARLQLTSGPEEGIWAMRSRELDGLLVVSQVVAIVEGDREEVEAQVSTAFDRLNDTVRLPEAS